MHAGCRASGHGSARRRAATSHSRTRSKGWRAFISDPCGHFWGRRRPATELLATNEQAQQVFERVRATLPDVVHATVDGLEQSCDERRQLAQQERLFRWLHGWLKIHVPCSVALLVFTVVHVITALYY